MVPTRRSGLTKLHLKWQSATPHSPDLNTFNTACPHLNMKRSHTEKSSSYNFSGKQIRRADHPAAPTLSAGNWKTLGGGRPFQRASSQQRVPALLARECLNVPRALRLTCILPLSKVMDPSLSPPEPLNQMILYVGQHRELYWSPVPTEHLKCG